MFGLSRRSIDAERGISPAQASALIGTSALAVYGMSRRSPLVVALAVGGATVAALAAKQKQRIRTGSLWTSLLVNTSPREAYQFWRNFENLPRFMRRLDSVTVLDESRSQWTAIGPLGKKITWSAEITSDRENEAIAWHSLPDSDIAVDGEVTFEEAPANRGTLISLRMRYSSPSGAGNTVSKFLNRGISFVLRQDLRRLEAIMEAGEIPTTEGQSHGPRDTVTGMLRVADPTRPIRPGSSLRELFQASRRIA